MILSFAICNVPTMPLRREPAHRSEQVSQILFGEKVEVLEINDKEWARIRCEWDNYEGWCKSSQIKFLHAKEYKKEIKFLNSTHSDKLIMEQGEMLLALGSSMFGMKGKKVPVNGKVGIFKGKKLSTKNMEASGVLLQAVAMQYLHAPYLWGGRSIQGIDCSGLTQMAYKLCGKRLPRDAWQQAMEGETVDFLQSAQCGDLAFFDNEEGKIIHVGMLLSNQTIIHATDTSGRVVVDLIDQGGIISHSLRKRTHQLRMIKRYL